MMFTTRGLAPRFCSFVFCQDTCRPKWQVSSSNWSTDLVRSAVDSILIEQSVIVSGVKTYDHLLFWQSVSSPWSGRTVPGPGRSRSCRESVCQSSIGSHPPWQRYTNVIPGEIQQEGGGMPMTLSACNLAIELHGQPNQKQPL